MAPVEAAATVGGGKVVGMCVGFGRVGTVGRWVESPFAFANVRRSLIIALTKRRTVREGLVNLNQFLLRAGEPRGCARMLRATCAQTR